MNCFKTKRFYTYCAVYTIILKILRLSRSDAFIGVQKKAVQRRLKYQLWLAFHNCFIQGMTFKMNGDDVNQIYIENYNKQ